MNKRRQKSGIKLTALRFQTGGRHQKPPGLPSGILQQKTTTKNPTLLKQTTSNQNSIIIVLRFSEYQGQVIHQAKQLLFTHKGQYNICRVYQHELRIRHNEQHICILGLMGKSNKIKLPFNRQLTKSSLCTEFTPYKSSVQLSQACPGDHHP